MSESLTDKGTPPNTMLRSLAASLRYHCPVLRTRPSALLLTISAGYACGLNPHLRLYDDVVKVRVSEGTVGYRMPTAQPNELDRYSNAREVNS